ncbi:hypothetical protein [Algibacillus agarilyticus]|uniref:hypothetical protein n=1 Tax=Algibacillus agarilyticus TaxID=2234133 RepID=UPI000DD059EC|nr:hypothetical protein [Algibacillus agarilyticus]
MALSVALLSACSGDDEKNGIDGAATADNANFRCTMLTSIAQNMLTMTTSIHHQWQISGESDSENYGAQLSNGTGDFTSVKDALEELGRVYLLCMLLQPYLHDLYKAERLRCSYST